MDKKEKRITPWFSLMYLTGGTIGMGVLSGSTVYDALSLLLMSAAVFAIVPTIARTIKRNPIEKRAAIKFAVINGAIGYLVFIVLFAVIFRAAGVLNAEIGLLVVAVFMLPYGALWYWPACAILRYGELKQSKKTTTTA